MYGTFYWVTFGLAAVLLLGVALLLTAWSPIFALIIAVPVAFLIALGMAYRRGAGLDAGEGRPERPRPTGALTESGQRAEDAGGAMGSSADARGRRGDATEPGVGPT